MENAQRDEALRFHRNARGKVQTFPTVDVRTEKQLALAYVPGCTTACEEINASPSLAFEYTGKGNRIAEISNAASVLGVGGTSPEASLPVLEGKCLVLKLMGDINAYPIALNAPTPEEIVKFCRMAAPSFGGINIEDIGSPDAFYVMRELSGSLGIPVFCDDQQGTAVIVLAAVLNSLKLLNISMAEAKIAVLGAGQGGIASTELLLASGAKDVIVLNEHGALGPSNEGDNPIQRDIAQRTNPRGISGGIDEALTGADIVIGLSRTGALKKENIKRMNKKPVVLALALPEPEISAIDAQEAGAFIYASGKMEDSNTLLNLHSFPGIVRGALDVRASEVTVSMLIAAANALANMVDRRHLSPERICPRFFGSERTPRIAEAVSQAAINDGVAANKVPEGYVYESTWYRLFGESER